MNTALAQLGFATHPTEAFCYFVGDGTDCFARRALPPDHRDDETVNKCMNAMQAEYTQRWPENTKPYPGIPELLTAIENLHLPMTILSNKNDDYTQVMVASLLPHWPFKIVRGAAPSVAPKPDPTAALDIAAELNIPPDDFLYLGDTNTDMQTAVSAGMYPVGALWGFRTADELLQNGAKTLVEKPTDILKLLKP